MTRTRLSQKQAMEVYSRGVVEGGSGGSAPFLKVWIFKGRLSPPLKNPSFFYILHNKT